MARIPTWFLVAAGVLVSGVSYYIGEKFRGFFYIKNFQKEFFGSQVMYLRFSVIKPSLTAHYKNRST